MAIYSSRSPEHRAFLEEVRPYVQHYFHRESVAERAGRLSATVVSGPRGIGKSTIMAASGIPIVKAGISRLPRTPDEDTYNPYLDFTNPRHRKQIQRGIEDGSFLQIAQHPANGELYFTTLASFKNKQGQPNVIDMTASEYQRIRAIGLIGNLTAAYIVTPAYEQWQQQLLGREGEADSAYIMNMREAFDSLTEGIQDPTYSFILNDTVPEAADNLARLARGDSLDGTMQTRGREAAHVLLEGITASGILDAS